MQRAFQTFISYMQFNSIRSKLLMYFMLAGLLPLAVVMFIEYKETDKALKERSFDHLTSIRAIKKRKIEQYFKRAKKEIQYFAANETVGQAMQDFREAFFSLKANQKEAGVYQSQLSSYYKEIFVEKLHASLREEIALDKLIPQDNRVAFLQHQYLIANKNDFQRSKYHQVHEEYHAEFSGFLKKFNYYDIFLVDDSTGHIIYSVAKEIDFGTSLLDGPYADTNLGQVFRELRHSGNVDDYKIIDFEEYLPSYQYPAAFMACPITKAEKRLGTLIFQVPITEINRVMTGNRQWEEEGFGKSGESYLIGADYMMRNDSRFIIQSPNQFFKQLLALNLADSTQYEAMKMHQTTILQMKVETEAVEAAINGITDTRVVQDYRGVDVLSSFTPLEIEGLDNWVLLSEIDAEEAFQASALIRSRFIFISLSAAVVIFFLAIWIASNFSRPVTKLSVAAAALSGGDLNARVSGRRLPKDEIGQSIIAFNKMAENIQTQRAAIIEQKAELEAQNEEIHQNMEEMQAQRDSLEIANKEIIQQEEELRQSTEELTVINEQLEVAQRNMEIRLKEEQEMRAALEQAQEQAQDAQSNLLQAEKMASLGEMTASIAHELNNPINFIAGGIQSLRIVTGELVEILNKYESIHAIPEEELSQIIAEIQGLKEEIDIAEAKEDAVALIEDIEQGANRATEIIVGLRNISRMDDKTLQLDDIHQNINATLIIMRSKYKDRIEIVTEYDEDLPQIECYPGQLSQVFMNLLGNAMDAIEGKGTITITTKNQPDNISIAIADSGIGMSEEIKQKIFSSFYTTKTVGKGTGLGLPIVQKIMDKHQGEIFVESEEGKGTIFTITIPKKIQGDVSE